MLDFAESKVCLAGLYVGKLHLSIELSILKDFLIIQTIILHEIVPAYEVGILAPRNCEHACTSPLVDAR